MLLCLPWKSSWRLPGKGTHPNESEGSSSRSKTLEESRKASEKPELSTPENPWLRLTKIEGPTAHIATERLYDRSKVWKRKEVWMPKMAWKQRAQIPPTGLNLGGGGGVSDWQGPWKRVWVAKLKSPLSNVSVMYLFCPRVVPAPDLCCPEHASSKCTVARNVPA